MCTSSERQFGNRETSLVVPLDGLIRDSSERLSVGRDGLLELKFADEAEKGPGDAISVCLSMVCNLNATIDWRWVKVRMTMSQCFVSESIRSSTSIENDESVVSP
jgi:hypothetical protein